MLILPFWALLLLLQRGINWLLLMVEHMIFDAPMGLQSLDDKQDHHEGQPPLRAIGLTEILDEVESRSLSTGGKRCYDVHRGHQIGIFCSWPDCQRVVSGYKNAEYMT